MSYSIDFVSNKYDIKSYTCNHDGFKYELTPSGILIITGVSTNKFLPIYEYFDLNNLNWIIEINHSKPAKTLKQCKKCRCIHDDPNINYCTKKCDGYFELSYYLDKYKICSKCGNTTNNDQYRCERLCNQSDFNNLYPPGETIIIKRYIFKNETIPVIKSYNLQNLFQNGSVSNIIYYKEILSKLTSLDNLEIKNCSKLTDISFIEQIETLQTISFENCLILEDISCLKNCKNLTSVSFKNCPLIKKAFWNGKCSISFQDCPGLTDVSDLANGDLNKYTFENCINLYDVSAFESCSNKNNYSQFIKGTKISEDPKWKCYFEDQSKSKIFYEKLREEIQGNMKTKQLMDENESLRKRLEKLEAFIMSQKQNGIDQDILDLEI